MASERQPHSQRLRNHQSARPHQTARGLGPKTSGQQGTGKPWNEGLVERLTEHGGGVWPGADRLTSSLLLTSRHQQGCLCLRLCSIAAFNNKHAQAGATNKQGDEPMHLLCSRRPQVTCSHPWPLAITTKKLQPVGGQARPVRPAGVGQGSMTARARRDLGRAQHRPTRTASLTPTSSARLIHSGTLSYHLYT